MPVQARASGITFAVHAVERATSGLPTRKLHVALRSLIPSEVESCCDYTADCVHRVDFHPMMAAAHFAFSQHRPLVLSPDMIWVTIVQGLAQHVKNHSERLRDRFVDHRGKRQIVIVRRDIHRGSPENAWDGVIHDISQAVRAHLGATYDRLIADFSTTGPAERAACEVALLDTFQPHFEYRLLCACGIPEITLEGTTGDWLRLRAKVDHLAGYDLDWWLPAVRRICGQFARAAAGQVDLEHWRDIYKRQTAYGWDVVNGWLVTLIPYLKNRQTGNFTIPNPLLTDPDAKVATDELPSGIALAPFRCQWRGRDTDEPMELLGGFAGVTQDDATLALRPKLGWAVRRSSGAERSLAAGLEAHHPVPPLDAAEFDRCFERLLNSNHLYEIPGDFFHFYKTCNGIRLFEDGKPAAYQFRRLEALELVEGVKAEDSDDDRDSIVHSPVGPWLRFCDLADGTFLALELLHTYERGWKIVRGGTEESRRNGLDPIVAWSFEEVLRRALDSGGRLDLPPRS